MHFWFKSLCLTLILNDIVMDPVEFEFNLATMGHSGLFISWKEKTIPTGDHRKLFFRIGYRIKDAPKDQNFTFSSIQHCFQFGRGYNIYSLKENTFYDVIIRQYSPIDKFSLYYDTFLPEKFHLQKEYTFVEKTNFKTNKNPTKPSFLSHIGNVRNNITDLQIIWLPCGQERNCSGKEPGSHFVVKSKVLDRRGEFIREVIDYDYINIAIMAGLLYEVTVLSAYNDIYIESDPQEIFLKPTFGTVRSVKVVSYPNASILITWKPPNYSIGELYKYRIIIANDSSHINNNLTYLTSMDVEQNGISNMSISYINATIEEKLFDKPDYKLVPGATYFFSIVPYGIYKTGLETQVKYILPVKNDD